MHIRVRTALLLTALFFTGIASGTELERASPFWVKSFFAKKNQTHACIYATVTSQQGLLNGEPRLYFDRIDKKGFSTAMFRVVNSKAKDRLGLNNEMGDVLEACLAPGDYIISAIVYSWGVYGQGAYSANLLRHENYAFRIEAGKNYYLGNIFIESDFIVQNAADRDKELIMKHAKFPPSSDLDPIKYFPYKWIK